MELKANKYGVFVHMINGRSELIECESNSETHRLIEKIKEGIMDDKGYVIHFGAIDCQTVINPKYIVEAIEVWCEKDTSMGQNRWYTRRNGKNIWIGVYEK